MKKVTAVFFLCSFVPLLFLLPAPVYADTTAHANVTLTIINNAPEITGLRIVPQEIYYDSEASCYAEAKDENPAKLRKEYAWYINGEFVKRADIFSGFEPGDKVECRAFAIDNIGQFSSEKRAGSTVLESPEKANTIKTLSLIAGTKIKTETAIDLDRQGIGAITGYVSRNSSYASEEGIVGILLVITLVVTLLNFRTYLKRRIRRVES